MPDPRSGSSRSPAQRQMRASCFADCRPLAWRGRGVRTGRLTATGMRGHRHYMGRLSVLGSSVAAGMIPNRQGKERGLSVTRSISEIWGRIEEHQGEDFVMKRGDTFTYEVSGNTLVTDRRVPYPIQVTQFEKALEMVPVVGPQQLHHLRGPSYIWAILHDPRIRRKDW
jgi:hypothetical protein